MKRLAELSVLGEFLKQNRRAHGWTQAEVGRKIGLKGRYPNSIVQNWEVGRRTPSMGNVSRLARLFGIDPASLLRLVLQARPSLAPWRPYLKVGELALPEIVEDAKRLPEWAELSPTDEELEMVSTATGYEGADWNDPLAVISFIQEQRERPLNKIESLFREKQVPEPVQEKCYRVIRALVEAETTVNPVGPMK